MSFLARKPKPRPLHSNFDNVRTGSASGQVMVVFAPPWWRVDRWLSWWLAGKARAKGLVNFHVPHDDGVTRAITLRAWQLPRK